MANNDLLVLRTDRFRSNLRPSIQVEHALTEIKDTYLTSPLARFLSQKLRHSEARRQCSRDDGNSGSRRHLPLRIS